MKKNNDEWVEQIIRIKEEQDSTNFDETQRIRNKENEYITMELRKAGFKVSSLFDLINFNQTNYHYIERLLEILVSDRLSDTWIKSGIIRAITVKNAKGISEKILLEYYSRLKPKLEKDSIGWSIGNWFECFYSDTYFGQISTISKNKSNGVSRQMFVMALGKTKKYYSEAEKLLLDLTHDDEVALHAISALGKLKSKKSIDRLTELTSAKNSRLKKEAKKSLKKIVKE
ncbi:hypothetical protein DFQ11_102600 [Winogradskyella epiphytica]|uniref:HEAT repeat protein n=1 Tax=Winogradskyella epiphytica TaxID=262005 RepID=A0A2V4WXP2_9FLAO|nr:HEAT repeat domain-containing protein [Winogradskyella epiphytica]PYE82020.1 hypothetical protein DFQ11_102600 [Winogradskyella epiphytica]GGW61050.1 hypothetical protein GCM10008085_10740 [Winogradskyella epiphytica]